MSQGPVTHAFRSRQAHKEAFDLCGNDTCGAYQARRADPAPGECGGGDSEADYSPDGTRFVFMRKQCGIGPDPSRDEAAALYVANTDGTGLHQITAYGQADSHPDGTKILLASQDHHLHLIHPTAAP